MHSEARPFTQTNEAIDDDRIERLSHLFSKTKKAGKLPLEELAGHIRLDAIEDRCVFGGGLDVVPSLEDNGGAEARAKIDP